MFHTLARHASSAGGREASTYKRGLLLGPAFRRHLRFRRLCHVSTTTVVSTATVARYRWLTFPFRMFAVTRRHYCHFGMSSLSTVFHNHSRRKLREKTVKMLVKTHQL